jgi:hypothetical protein
MSKYFELLSMGPFQWPTSKSWKFEKEPKGTRKTSNLILLYGQAVKNKVKKKGYLLGNCCFQKKLFPKYFQQKCNKLN